MTLEITVEELAGLEGLVDVRSAEEFAEAHVEDALHVPQLEAQLERLRGAHVVTVCTKGGGRSLGAATLLRERGIEARYLAGGTLAWLAAHPAAQRVEPVRPDARRLTSP